MVSESQSMDFLIIDDLLVVRQFKETIEDPDWQLCMKHLESVNSLSGVLVYCPSGAPSAEQRTDIRGIHERFGVKLAVLTRSKLTVGVLTALSWFGVPARAFPIGNIEKALEFVSRADLVGQVVEAVTEAEAITKSRGG